MFCLQCGTENADDSKFCKECGTLVGTPVSGVLGRPMRGRLSPQIAEELGAGAQDNPQLQRLMELALWHSQAGNVPAAILSCETALLIDSENVSALSLLGCLYERQGQIDKAIAVFERVVQISPESEADLAKLNSLRRGEYLPPVPQPFGYQWLPPMLVKTFSTSKQLRVGAASAAALLVLGVGLITLLRHGNSTAGADANAPSATQFSGQPLGSPAVSTARPTGVGTIASTALQPNASYTAPPPITVVSASTHSVGGDAPTTQFPAPSRAINPSIVGGIVQRSLPGGRRQAVPPLGVTIASNNTVPSVTSIQPLDAGSVKIASADVPQHTVLVAPMPGDSAQGAGSGNTQGTDAQGQDNSQPPLPASHVYIRVHNDDAGSAAPPAQVVSSVPASAPQPAPMISQTRGGKLQSQALQAQQGGSYKQASRLYRAAINAYRDEVAQGQFVSEAQRGIAACETGLQICQENQ